MSGFTGIHNAVLSILRRDSTRGHSLPVVHVAMELRIAWEDAKEILDRLVERGVASKHARTSRYWVDSQSCSPRPAARRKESRMSMKMRERYATDPVFHAMVDALHSWIERGDTTPTEVREAAMLAQIMYEERRRPRPMIFSAEQVRNDEV